MKLGCPIAGVTRKEFKKVWDVHEEANWRMSDCDMQVKIRDIDIRLRECKRNQEVKRMEKNGIPTRPGGGKKGRRKRKNCKGNH